MESEKSEEIARQLRNTFSGGKTKTPVWRKQQLKSILKLVLENEEEICNALNADLGKHRVEAYRDEASSFFWALEFEIRVPMNYWLWLHSRTNQSGLLLNVWKNGWRPPRYIHLL